jgi:SAM-dependent methyltransferase
MVDIKRAGLVCDMSDDFRFKRVWDKAARSTSPGVLIFGPLWGFRYSRSWDQREFNGFEELLQMDGDGYVLDVGCGPPARAEVYFGRRGIKVVGVDVSVTVASQAKMILRKFKVNKNVDLLVADAEFLPFKEKSFGQILANGLLVHLPTKESVVRTLGQFRFCMKKNGRCYIVWLPNLYSVVGPLFKFVTRIGFVGKTEQVQLLTFNGLKEIRHICSQAGLKISRVFHNTILWVGLYLFPAFTHKYIEKMVSMQNEFDRRHLTISSFPYSFNIVIERN